ncbi:MAG: hypothetical protein WCP20_24530, partial [Desulfuromonadales bacterium]
MLEAVYHNGHLHWLGMPPPGINAKRPVTHVECGAFQRQRVVFPAHLTHNASVAGVSCKTHVRHTPRAIPDYPTITAVSRTISSS